MRTIVVMGLALLVTSCASLVKESDCRGVDWYQIGRIEGEIYGIGNQIDQHTHRCARFGVTPDAAQYNVGWADGNTEFRLRTGFVGGGDAD